MAAEERARLPGAGPDLGARHRLIAEIASCRSIDELFAQLRQALSSHGMTDFAVFTVTPSNVSLAFSSGAVGSVQSDGGTDLSLDSGDWLQRFVVGSDPFAIPTADPIRADSLKPSAAFRLASDGSTLGIIVVYGRLPLGMFEQPLLGNLRATTAAVSATFRRLRERESTERALTRANSRLREFQEGQEILLLSDRPKIVEALLARALKGLGSTAGCVCLGSEGGWDVVHQTGSPSEEAMAARDPMVERCLQQGRPGIIGSLSGEETWAFDVDTIHMAAVAVFPLTTQHQCLGCLAVFDATVSLDAVDTVSGTALVGGMAIENWLNRKRMSEQHRLKEQMALAAEVQQRLLPSDPPVLDGISVALFSKYCDETGGDYVDAVSSTDPHVCTVAVGDVAGHGLGAAMLMVDVRARLRTLLGARLRWSPQTVLEAINRILERETKKTEFVTLFVGTLDTRTGVLRYASAGHEPPLHYSARTESWRELPATGVPLGMLENVSYEADSVVLEPGDLLVLLTDGVTEAAGRGGELFGTERVMQVVQSTCHEPAQAILDVLVAETMAHCGQQAFTDDLTYMLVKADDIRLREADGPPKLPGRALRTIQAGSGAEDKERVLAEIETVLSETYPSLDATDILVSAEEALQNAVAHGNRQHRDKTMQVQVWGDQESIAIQVADEGDGFSPRERVPQHFTEAGLQEASGRGLVIMASLMDGVTYWDKGRALVLTKNIGARA